jgi:hypothetical protein
VEERRELRRWKDPEEGSLKASSATSRRSKEKITSQQEEIEKTGSGKVSKGFVSHE